MMGRVVKFVKSLLEALLLNWTVFILDVNSKPKKVFNQIVNKPEHCLH